MSARLIISPRAEAHMDGAKAWYEAQSPGLGDEFTRVLEAKLAEIVAFPAIGVPLRANYRRVRLLRFPLQLFYALEDEAEIIVVIIACIHERSNPQKWQKSS